MPMLGTVGAGAARGFGETVQTKPPVAGFLAWYDTTSVVGTSWRDKSGNGYNATIAGATLTATSGNGATGLTTALFGSATANTVVWPSGILPATYTLFHVTRYTGTTNSRIYTTAGGVNWLSGHWGGLSGQYYHSGWITNNVTSYYANNWFITTDLNTIVRTNGIARTGGAGAGSPSYGPLTINAGTYNPGESSTWMTAECIVYNTNLSAGNYALVESYLARKYGITLNT